MNIFKRIEVWILLVLVGAGIVFVLMTNRDGGNGDGDGDGGSGRGTRFVVKKTTVKRDYGNFEAEIALTYDNRSGGEIDTATAAKLIGENGKRIPVFFLAIAMPPKIPAGKKNDLSLRFWLEPEDVKGSLSLEILGENVEVKNGTPLDPESIPNQEKRTYEGTEWK